MREGRCSLVNHFERLQSGSLRGVPSVKIACGTEFFFAVPKRDRVVVYLPLMFEDSDTRLLLHSILREFEPASNLADSGPPMPNYMRGELPEDIIAEFPGAQWSKLNALWFSWTFLPRHVSSVDQAIDFILGFRPFLSYHAACTKAHMQTNMRRRCDVYCSSAAQMHCAGGGEIPNL